jgi:transposase
LAAENATLRRELDEMKARIAELEAELRRHSGTSGKPPSSDTLAQRAEQNQERLSRAERRRRARAVAKQLMKKVKRRPGKQPGVAGQTLTMVDDPDEVVVHAPEVCAGCGASLAAAATISVERRQVFDLPEIRAKVTEHRAETRVCSCGHATSGAFPVEARSPACYGPSIRALGAYLMGRQHFPVKRAAELLSDVVGVPVSTGFLAGVIPEAADGLGGFLERLRELLRAAEVLHADETGARIAGVRYWFHTVSDALLTYLDCHPKRGLAAFTDMGVLDVFCGVLISDGWKPYWSLQHCSHALCGAHVLRDLAAVAEVDSQAGWANAMADLLVEAKLACDQARDEGLSTLPAGKLKALRRRYTMIVHSGWAANPDPGRKRNRLERESYNLLRRLENQRDELCRSWVDLAVDFDNNEAERSLRMLKLQQKISGCFRTLEGAKAFCALRSYTQTAMKQGVNVLDALRRLFEGDPWMAAIAGP